MTGVVLQYATTMQLVPRSLADFENYVPAVTPPTTQASNITFANIEQTQMDVLWTNGDGANRVVIMNSSNSFTNPVDGIAPSANTVYGGGEQVIYNGSASTIPTVTGLSAGTIYWYRVYEYNGSGSTAKYLNATATNNPHSQLTSASATAPLISSPTATAITTTSAVLGGNITSDGGSAITARGTLWSTTSPVTISDNILAEGNTATGVFTHTRTSLPSNTLIYYAAYATNAAGTTLSSEASFTTLKTEPTNHVTTFAAGTPTVSSIPLTWTVATGAVTPDGYLILYNTTGSFIDPVDGTPQVNGTGIQNIAQGVQTYTATGLTPGTPYYFKIWSYTNSGTDINYKIDGTVPTANATTLAVPSAIVDLRPTHIDLSATTSESAVLMTLANYSLDDVRYRLYNGSNQYACWDVVTESYITATSYLSGPLVPGTPSTSTTFWIVFQRGNNLNAVASYRDRLNPYTANYQTIALPAATEITVPFALTGIFSGSGSYTTAAKHVVLAYSGTALISAASTALTTGNFAVVCPDGTTINKIEIRAVDNTLIESLTGTWSTSTNVGNIPDMSTSFTGAGNWSAPGNWSNGIPTSANDAIIDGDVTIDLAAETKDLTINSGKSVTISDTKSLTVSGTLTNSAGNSGLIVSSGASLITNNSVPATVKRDFTGGTNFHYFCLPVSGSSIVASPTFNGAWLDEYDESTGAWTRLSDADNVVSGKGYSINFEAANTPLSFSGTLYANDLIIGSLTYTGAVAGYGPGWHLLGNPFTAALDLNSSSWALTNVDAYAYVWNGSNYLVGPTLPANANGFTYSTLPGNLVPAMQGFFVHANAGNASITIPAAARTHSSQAFYKSTNAAKDALSLTIDGNGYEDKALVAFNPSATANFDGQYDAYKLFGIDAAPQLYSIIPNEKAAVNTLPDVASNSNVALGLKVGASTSYTLNVSGIESFDASLPIRLDDLKMGTSQDLRINPVYTFDAAPGDAENRFMLSFASVTAVNQQNPAGIKVISENGIIRVTHNAPATGTVYLYSVSGQLLETATLNKGETTLRAASNGVYLVKVVTGKTSLTRKMVVLQ